MSEKSPPVSQVVRSRVQFPTDRITLGVMRRVEPERFEEKALASNVLRGSQAIAMLMWECVLADKAYAAAAHVSDPHSEVSRDYVVSVLNEAYVQYGISRGSAETMELVRRFEAMAAVQARVTTR